MILLNNAVRDIPGFSEKIFEDGLSIYEVIRIFNGHPIFLKDNMERLSNSLRKSNAGIRAEQLDIPGKLERLVRLENMTEGNLKYVLHFTKGGTDEYIFRIPHAYPTAEDYEKGVAVATCRAVRENPEVKYVNSGLRALSNRLMRERGVYEVLLTDGEDCITEGSRSNVFFVKGETLYTCPREYVLPGTSRKRVCGLCGSLGIPVVEKRIPAGEIGTYESAFLTGTSPLILPVSRIDRIPYRTDTPFLRRLMRHYFALLEEEAALPSANGIRNMTI